MSFARCTSFLVALAACGAAPKSPAKAETAADWTRACAARLEAARAAVPALASGAVKIDPKPWQPTVRFEAHAGQGHWESAVSIGHDPCSDYDSDDPSLVNLAWSDAKRSNAALDRVHRVNGDGAWLQADGVARETLEPFRAAFQRALDGCLADARGVHLGSPPADFSCVDKNDVCPTKPSAADVADGCPR